MLQKIRESFLYKIFVAILIIMGSVLIAAEPFFHAYTVGSILLLVGGPLLSILSFAYMTHFDKEKKVARLADNNDERKKFIKDNGWKKLKRSTYKDGDMIPPFIGYLFILDTMFDLTLSATLVQLKLLLLLPALLLFVLSYIGREIKENRRAKKEFLAEYIDIDHEYD